jgi:hypothetical protein
MAMTGTERMRAHRARRRRRVRKLTVEVSEDDLQVLAERGYECAAGSDHCAVTPASAAHCYTVTPRCGATAEAVTASLLGPNVVL